MPPTKHSLWFPFREFLGFLPNTSTGQQSGSTRLPVVSNKNSGKHTTNQVSMAPDCGGPIFCEHLQLCAKYTCGWVCCLILADHSPETLGDFWGLLPEYLCTCKYVVLKVDKK